MKKAVLLVLALAMLLVLCACSGQSFGDYVESELQEVKDLVGGVFGSSREEDVWSEEEAIEAVLPEPEDHSDAPEEAPDWSIFEESVSKAAPAVSGSTSDNFEVITVVDSEDCTVKITGIHPDSMWGCTLDLYLENKSRRDTYDFYVDYAYINGLRCEPFFSVYLDGGEAVTETLYLSDAWIRESGITEFADIVLSFNVYDYDDWSEPVAEENIRLRPYGEREAARYTRTPQESDLVLCETDDFTVTLLRFEADPGWSYDGILYIENSSDRAITISADGVEINGIDADPYYIDSLPANTSAYSRMTWDAYLFENTGIDTINEITFTLTVYDDETYDTLAQEDITVTK